MSNKLVYDETRINNLTRKYIKSDVDAEDKIIFMKLRKEYLRIKGIENYQQKQEKLYKKKSKKEILEFEIIRILSDGSLNMEVACQATDIDRLLKMYDGELPEYLYSKVVAIIIKLELILGMNVGLFNELCLLFETELKKIDDLDSKTISSEQGGTSLSKQRR